MYRRLQRAACARRVKFRRSQLRRHFLAVEPLEERRLLAGMPSALPEGNIVAGGAQVPDNGPQIAAIVITGAESYSLFNPVPSVDGATPLVRSLTIRVEDESAAEQPLPGDYNDDGVVDASDLVVWRLNNGQAVTLPNDPSPGVVNDDDFETWRENFGATASSAVLDLTSAQDRDNYFLVGDFTGEVRIRQVNIEPVPPTKGAPPAADIELIFDRPLPDDRYTLFISDAVTDAEGNPLDGETDPDEPTFPTGDGEPGGNFEANFIVDSRPEVGSRLGTDINVDINGNRFWDPFSLGDPTNIDLVFNLPLVDSDGIPVAGGFGTHDQLLAGKFVKPGGDPPDRLFDQLAAFGFVPAQNAFRWLVDTDGDGVIELGTDIVTTQPALPAGLGFNIASAQAIAGEFDSSRPGDEVGLYNVGKWAFDTNGDRVITDADLVITNNLVGYPVVGDFDGDARDDLAVFSANTWSFDLANNGFGSADRTLLWGLPGTQDRPLAADMDQDGIDDIGLWLPGAASTPAKFRFLVSNDLAGTRRVVGNINTLNHAFLQAPSGNDIYIEFGGEGSRPIVGNFGPPTAGTQGNGTVLASGVPAGVVVDQPSDPATSSFSLQKANLIVRKSVQLKPAIADAVLSDTQLLLTQQRNLLEPEPMSDPLRATEDHHDSAREDEFVLHVAFEIDDRT
ncbi:MAG TPA: VCBS repeat-containing protein [Lacipirellulaceae bacterium]|nr:VCBS repeat-containing protein [Lacipirellulaceae bacterium]